MIIMKQLSLFLAFVLSIGFLSCDSPGDANVDPPQELITHVLLTLKDSANVQDSVVASFVDIDGPSGSGQPVITGVTLKGGRTYFGSIRFLEAIADRDDTLIEVTDEVLELGTQHQVFYQPDNTLQTKLTVRVTDRDANALPLGLATIIHTQDFTSPVVGNLNVVLSHFEELGSKNGTDRSSESDVDVNFPVTIQ